MIGSALPSLAFEGVARHVPRGRERATEHMASSGRAVLNILRIEESLVLGGAMGPLNVMGGNLGERVSDQKRRVPTIGKAL